ncbi:hypothetical protein [Mycolicibacterium gadium]|uniref:Uncharacterized protein n=1 Tax=Mycolicibacterium gadium TaxID=1794 RepID=A0ABT6GKQ3_MYCGU|nr:hypothetical protein [Mycolicibacterium gadium]MDG5481990.1 hypothetical protein [Mycolicibacterium gadium]
MLLDVWLLRVTTEPLGLHSPRRSQRRFQPNPGDTAAEIGSQAGDHPCLLGGVEPAKDHLQFEFVGDPVSLTVVSEVFDPQPASGSRTRFCGQHRPQPVDDVALTGIVLADENRERAADLERPFEIAVARCP